MPLNRNKDIILLKENSVWLRYVFFAAALGMCFLSANIFSTLAPDYGKVYGSAAGGLLLGFCGFTLKIRRVFADIVKREIAIETLGLRQSSIERIKFDEIKNIQVLVVPDTYEDSNGRSIPSKSWSTALALKDRKVTINLNPLTQKQASDISSAIQNMIPAKAISGNTEEAIMALLQSGRKIDAIKVAISELGLALEQAKDFVDKKCAR